MASILRRRVAQLRDMRVALMRSDRRSRAVTLQSTAGVPCASNGTSRAVGAGRAWPTQSRAFTCTVANRSPERKAPPEQPSTTPPPPTAATAGSAGLSSVPGEGLSGVSMLREFLRYVWPSGDWGAKARVLAALGLLIGSKLLLLQVPLLFKTIVDSLTLSGGAGAAAVTAPVALIVAYGAARAGASLFNELRNATFASVAQHAIRAISRRTFEHLHRMPLGFHLGRQTGALSRALDRGGRGVTFVMNAMVFNIFPTLLEVSMVTGLLSYRFGWSYGALTLGTIAAYAALTLGITQWRTRFRVEMNAMENEASNRTIDSLINFETVKYFTAEEHEARRYDHYIERYNRAALKTQTSLALLNSTQAFVLSGAITAMMLMAANGIAAGTMTVGDLVMVNAFLFQLSVPLNFLGSVYREIRQALIDMDAMFRLLNSPTGADDDSQSSAATAELRVTDGRVAFERVTFAYTPLRETLRDLSFTVDAGHTCGIVGPSGSGKSTILRLLFRFYEPQGGRITIDGQDIGQCAARSLRRQIGVVPQDTVLFNDTIMYNIWYGNLDASEEQVREAARRAQLHDAIERMPHGYETVVGERGLKLSGGEKQRLALARVLLKDAPIVLFDEATSALDSSTERSIMDNIRELSSSRQRTTIIVAHRLSTVAHAEQILVLDERGALAERGTHNDLMASRGLYYHMWQQQQEQQQQQQEQQQGASDELPA